MEFLQPPCARPRRRYSAVGAARRADRHAPSLDESLPGVNRADALIIRGVPEHQAVRALERMLRVVERTRHEHPFLMPLGVLPVRVRPRWALHAEFLASIEELAREFGYPVLPAVPESQDVLRYSLGGRY